MKGQRQESAGNVADLSICSLSSKAGWGVREGVMSPCPRLCQRQSFLLKWTMLRPQVILSTQKYWSDWFYDPLECIQWLWHEPSFWACMFQWKIITNHNTSAEAVKLFIALRLAIPVAKQMNQTLTTWFWSLLTTANPKSFIKLLRNTEILREEFGHKYL